MSDERQVIVEVTVSAPVQEVWRWLRDPDAIRRWHGWEYDGLEAEIAEIYVDNVVVSEAERTIEAADNGGTFEVSEVGERTVVRLTRGGLTGNAEWDAFYDAINEGWTTFVQQLAFALERHPDAERRTIYLSGEARSADTDPVAELGLAALAAAEPGDPYEVTLATGESLAGEVWFRSENQLGLTVDGYGDGLLIVTGAWAQAHGDAAALITTYGLGEAELAKIERRWRGWWGERYAKAGVG